MAQPVSSAIWDLAKRDRSIAHSDDFERHKSIQTKLSQQILLAWIQCWCPASRDQTKPLLAQPQISCNANGWGCTVPNPIARDEAPETSVFMVIFFRRPATIGTTTPLWQSMMFFGTAFFAQKRFFTMVKRQWYVWDTATTCFKNQAPNNSNETTTRAATVQQQQQQEQLLWGSFTIYLGFVCGCWGCTLKEKEPLETR